MGRKNRNNRYMWLRSKLTVPRWQQHRPRNSTPFPPFMLRPANDSRAIESRRKTWIASFVLGRYPENALVVRTVLASVACLLLSSGVACAQQWAVKMFNTTSHEFGTVARGSTAQFRFQVKNIYEEDAHISSVRSSCGCTTASVTRPDLKTFETGEVVADFNTRDFLGHKTATITVTFDKPFPAEVQLQVAGTIQSDVVLQPGALHLGTVDVGKSVEQKLRVDYLGNENWRIVDVKTLDPHFEVEITELPRTPQKTSYELTVRLTPDAPVGYIKDQLILVTNNPRAAELPVDLEGRVVSDITISPSQLFIGVVQPGQKVTKKLVVRGKKPFRIVDVQCADKSFEIEPPKEARAVHLIPVVFTAGDDPGRIAQKISIMTDQGDNVVQAFTAFAEIAKP